MKINNCFSLLFTYIFLVGCSSTSTSTSIKNLSEESNVNLDEHIVRLNRDGLVTKTDISGRSLLEKIRQKPLGRNEAEENINTIFKQAEELACSKIVDNNCKNSDRKIPVKLLIHIHGGLNYFSASDDRVKETANKIVNDKKDWHYPVFISWPTSFPGTYADHLVSVREGRNVKAILGWGSSPFIFLADIVKSIGKYPLDLYYQIVVNGKDKIVSSVGHDWLSYAWKKANKEYNNECVELGLCVISDTKVTLNRSSYYTTVGNSAGRVGLLTVTAPLRYTLGTLGQSSIAAASWKNMKRRTKNIFYPPRLFDDRENDGMAGGEFFDLLFKRIEDNRSDFEYQVTVIGHSMGSIVLNNAFKQYRNEWKKSNVLRNIIFMGAACSISETVDAVFPLLRTINDNQVSHKLRFYNLMLNRVAEISEITVKGAAPSGSLLTYIDQHLETPEHPFDRTLGSEVNVHSSLTALKKELRDVGKYIEFKAFDSYPGYIPNTHGSFNDAPFWKKSFWEVQTQTKSPTSDKPLPKFNSYEE